MNQQVRQYAQTHWAALDAVLSRMLRPDEVALCRAAFRWNVDELSEAGAHRLAGEADDTSRLELVESGRLLAAALTAAWRSDEGADPR
jgi:hypothetical protein